MLEVLRRQLQLLVLLIAALLLCPACNGQDIAFCSFPLSKGVLQAHASFNAVYEFDVNEHGTPIKIAQVGKSFVKLEDVQTCLAQWNLSQSASKHIVAVFEWQHGVGWTKLSISGPDIKLTVHLSGERCPYCDVRTASPH